MTVRAILVQIDIDDLAADRVRLAADLADRFQAALIGTCACAVQPVPTNGMAVGVTLFVEDPSEIEKQLQTVESKFRDLVAGKGSSTEWRASLALPTDNAALQARAADLIVTGRSRERSVYRNVDSAELIMLAGRPVLVVPGGVSHLAADRILVAWKDTREARRAVLDSLPLLEQASVVTVAIVPEKADSTAAHAATDVAAFLRGHGVKTEEIRAEADGSAGDRIIKLATEQGADLIVAGAYGHSRFREWIFGGVTRDLLLKSPICCLMAN